MQYIAFLDVKLRGDVNTVRVCVWVCACTQGGERRKEGIITFTRPVGQVSYTQETRKGRERERETRRDESLYGDVFGLTSTLTRLSVAPVDWSRETASYERERVCTSWWQVYVEVRCNGAVRGSKLIRVYNIQCFQD